MITTIAAVAFLIMIAKGMGLAYLVTKFEPLKILVELATERYPNLFTYVVALFFTCMSCATFWITLLMFGFWPAVAAYFIATVFDKSIGKWLNTVKF